MGQKKSISIFCYITVLKDFKCLIEADLVGDGGRIDPQFVILFSELGGRSNCFLSKTDICL